MIIICVFIRSHYDVCERVCVVKRQFSEVVGFMSFIKNDFSASCGKCERALNRIEFSVIISGAFTELLLGVGSEKFIF